VPWLVTVKFGESPGMSYTLPGGDDDFTRAWMRQKADAITRRIAKSGGKATVEYVEDDDAKGRRNGVGVRR
jgi:hypothetical protein